MHVLRFNIYLRLNLAQIFAQQMYHTLDLMPDSQMRLKILTNVNKSHII